jgi:2-keto-4-pentenoate hydratase/2-oxohepta-3-ene-1,7-dioic acid hydratase in catechol pathway
MIGSAGEIIAQIDALTANLPVTDLIGWGTPPGMDPAEFNPRLERFAREVISHFR